MIINGILWIFKSGDLSTVTVFSTCPCDNLLSWVVVRGKSTFNEINSSSKNFIQWGKESGQPYDHRMKQTNTKSNLTHAQQNSNPGYDDMCAYRIGYVLKLKTK